MARILLVEGSPRKREAYCRVLERAGHAVETATNGRSAVSIFRNRPADLVIADLILPEMDGLETIRTLRRDFPHVKIIALCGETRLRAEIGLRAALALGALCGLKKPVTPARMLRAVFDLLGTLPVSSCTPSPENPTLRTASQN